MRLVHVGLACVAAWGCAGPSTAVDRALAVGLVSLGTGAATTASTCAESAAAECERVSWRSGTVVLGVALAAGAQAWLEYQDDAALERARAARSAAAREAAARRRAAPPPSPAPESAP
jgi:hypothetical protein